LTANTVMHRTKVPIRTWFNAAFLVTSLTPPAAQGNRPTYAHQSEPSICAVDSWVERSVEGYGWWGERGDQVS
jgi:hypothetical protein